MKLTLKKAAFLIIILTNIITATAYLVTHKRNGVLQAKLDNSNNIIAIERGKQINPVIIEKPSTTITTSKKVIRPNITTETKREVKITGGSSTVPEPVVQPKETKQEAQKEYINYFGLGYNFRYNTIFIEYSRQIGILFNCPVDAGIQYNLSDSLGITAGLRFK